MANQHQLFSDEIITTFLQDYVKHVLQSKKEEYLQQEQQVLKDKIYYLEQFQCPLKRDYYEIPVILQNCNHYLEWFDLKTFLQNPNLNVELQCPHCSKKIELVQNQQLNEQWFQYFRLSIIRYELLQQLGSFPKVITYFPQLKIFIPSTPFKTESISNDFCYKIIEQQYNQTEENQIYQFNSLAQECKFEGEFNSLCILSKQKLKIPIRGQCCNHMEAYDLVQLLQYMTEKKQNKKKCILAYCKSQFDVKDISSFKIDFGLIKAYINGPAFSLIYNYKKNQNNLSNQCQDSQYLINNQQQSKIEQNIDPIIKTCFDEFHKMLDQHNQTNELQIQNTQRRQTIYEFQQIIYKYCDTIFHFKQHNADLTNKFYTSYQPVQNTDFQEIDNKILFPARCIKCKTLHVCDFRKLVYLIYLLKNNLVNKQECPLCKQPFSKKDILKQIYIDTKFYIFLLSTTIEFRSYQNFLISFQLNNNSQYIQPYNYEKYMNDMMHSLKVVIVQEFQDIFLYKFNTNCLLTRNKILIPVRNKSCLQKGHYNCFDRDSLIQYFLDNLDNIQNIVCPLCKQQFGSLENFYIDQTLYQILQKGSELIKYANIITIKPKSRDYSIPKNSQR